MSIEAQIWRQLDEHGGLPGVTREYLGAGIMSQWCGSVRALH